MTNPNPHIAQELLAHQAFLRRLATDLVGADADDLVQEVWRKALERPPRHGRQLRGWLSRVARNLAAEVEGPGKVGPSGFGPGAARSTGTRPRPGRSRCKGPA